MSQAHFTTTTAAKRLLVNQDKVLGWIRSGELEAINVSNGIRPRWRISPEALARFLQTRSNRRDSSGGKADKPKRARLAKPKKNYF